MIANALLVKRVDYRLAVRYFASAFDLCERLSAADQKLLLKNTAQRISEQLSAAALREE